MPSLLIRRVEESTKAKLRARASRHGRSMEQEAREILKAAVANPVVAPIPDLAQAMHAPFAAIGGVELPTLPRGPMRKLPVF